MVAYLKKPEKSEEFHQIVDFINASHIRYALTANPTICVSYIKQFWQTATARTLDNGEIELTTTIDGQVKTVTEASVRRHLQLADADGISSLLTTKIFEQLSLMGNMKRASKGYTGENIPLFPTMIVQGPVVQGEGSTHPPRSPTQTYVADEVASTGVDVRYGGAATTIIALEVGKDSGNIDKTPTMPQDLPLPRVNILGSDEGGMTIQELMVLCITLSKKVESLETDMEQTKKLYGAAYTKLIKKVKKLEKTAKSSQARRRARIVVSDDEDDLEDPSKQGRKISVIDQDPIISLVQHDAEIQGRHDMESEFDFDADKEVSTAEKDIRTAKPVSTAGAAVTTASVAVSIVSPIRVSTADDITMVYMRKSAAKDKGKRKMDESKTIQTKTKRQQEQERFDFETAKRLQAEFEEEERQRIASVDEAASFLNIKEWDDIQARVEADEELVHRAKERRNKPPTQAQQRTYMSNYIKNMGGYTLQQLRGYSFDEIKTLFETTIRKVKTFVPIESEVNKAVPELAAGSSKRDVEEELDQESSKRQKTGESSELAEEPRDKEDGELSQEELQQMMIIVPEQGMNVEALQTKYPIIDWEIYTEGTRKYRVGNHTKVYQFFVDIDVSSCGV
ncbi:hypothetical protein Tco_1245707 [Tanacetum coccineum]